MSEPHVSRDRATRIRDTLHRLAHDVDAWVATADPDTGTPYLIPLSFLWIDATLIIATPAKSPTARNLVRSGMVQLGIGTTRDVVLIEGTTQALSAEDITVDLGDAFAEKTGFDPRTLTTPYQYFRITPRRVQAWREANELAGRTLMRDGSWLTS